MKMIGMNQSLDADLEEARAWVPDPAGNKTELLRQIRDALSAQRLRPGDRLPNERELALRSGLSRTAVRDILAVLERQGTLARHVGRGTYVTNMDAAEGSTVRPSIAEVPLSPAELMIFRAVVEPAMIDTIIFGATDADLHALRGIVAQGAEVESWLDAEMADRNFHRFLYDMTGNRLFRSVGQEVSVTRAQAAWTRLKSSSFAVSKWVRYQQEHEAIANAIGHRDAERARLLLREHLVGVRQSALVTMGDL